MDLSLCKFKRLLLLLTFQRLPGIYYLQPVGVALFYLPPIWVGDNLLNKTRPSTITLFIFRFRLIRIPVQSYEYE